MMQNTQQSALIYNEYTQDKLKHVLLYILKWTIYCWICIVILWIYTVNVCVHGFIQIQSLGKINFGSIIFNIHRYKLLK